MQKHMVFLQALYFSLLSNFLKLASHAFGCTRPSPPPKKRLPRRLGLFLYAVNLSKTKHLRRSEAGGMYEMKRHALKSFLLYNFER